MAETVTKSVSKKKNTEKAEQSSVKTRENQSSLSVNPAAHQILHLQQTMGNQAVQRMIKSGTLQAKLKIGKPNDKYEQEADRIADRVMRMPEPQNPGLKEEEEKDLVRAKPLAGQITPLIQRKADDEEELEKAQAQGMDIQRRIDEEEEDLEPDQGIGLQPKIDEDELAGFQTKGNSGSTPNITPSIASNIRSLKGGGQPLSASTRSFFEPRFGADFSNVRVHTNSKAAETAKSINAKAFTTGKDVVFGAGEYSPGTSTGKRLLAHELTHVVQQSRDIINKKSINCKFKKKGASQIKPKCKVRKKSIEYGSGAVLWSRSVVFWFSKANEKINELQPDLEEIIEEDFKATSRLEGTIKEAVKEYMLKQREIGFADILNVAGNLTSGVGGIITIVSGIRRFTIAMKLMHSAKHGSRAALSTVIGAKDVGSASKGGYDIVKKARGPKTDDPILKVMGTLKKCTEILKSYIKSLSVKMLKNFLKICIDFLKRGVFELSQIELIYKEVLKYCKFIDNEHLKLINQNLVIAKDYAIDFKRKLKYFYLILEGFIMYGGLMKKGQVKRDFIEQVLFWKSNDPYRFNRVKIFQANKKKRVNFLPGKSSLLPAHVYTMEIIERPEIYLALPDLQWGDPIDPGKTKRKNSYGESPTLDFIRKMHYRRVSIIDKKFAQFLKKHVGLIIKTVQDPYVEFCINGVQKEMIDGKKALMFFNTWDETTEFRDFWINHLDGEYQYMYSRTDRKFYKINQKPPLSKVKRDFIKQVLFWKSNDPYRFKRVKIFQANYKKRINFYPGAGALIKKLIYTEKVIERPEIYLALPDVRWGDPVDPGKTGRKNSYGESPTLDWIKYYGQYRRVSVIDETFASYLETNLGLTIYSIQPYIEFCVYGKSKVKISGDKALKSFNDWEQTEEFWKFLKVHLPRIYLKQVLKRI